MAGSRPPEPYFPDGSFSDQNLRRKLAATFSANDVDLAASIVGLLDEMPVVQDRAADELRSRCKFDAIWYSRGDLGRLQEAVDLGMRDFPTLMMVEADRNLDDWDSDKFRFWVLD